MGSPYARRTLSCGEWSGGCLPGQSLSKEADSGGRYVYRDEGVCIFPLFKVNGILQDFCSSER